MTRCAKCNAILIKYEEVHALNGELFCSRKCAIEHYMNDIIMNAKEMAIEAYDSEAEVVAAADILGEDFHDVEVTVTLKKTIQIPKTFTVNDAICEAKALVDEDFVVISTNDCDSRTFTGLLVKVKNSEADHE